MAYLLQTLQRIFAPTEHRTHRGHGLLRTTESLWDDLEPNRKRRKYHHSTRDNVVSVSDCEQEEAEEAKGFSAYQCLDRRRIRKRKSHRIRHYSYSSSEHDDELSLNEKGELLMGGLETPELGSFTSDYLESAAMSSQLSRPRELLRRIRREVSKLKSKLLL